MNLSTVVGCPIRSAESYCIPDGKVFIAVLVSWYRGGLSYSPSRVYMVSVYVSTVEVQLESSGDTACHTSFREGAAIEQRSRTCPVRALRQVCASTLSTSKGWLNMYVRILYKKSTLRGGIR